MRVLALFIPCVLALFIPHALTLFIPHATTLKRPLRMSHVERATRDERGLRVLPPKCAHGQERRPSLARVQIHRQLRPHLARRFQHQLCEMNQTLQGAETRKCSRLHSKEGRFLARGNAWGENSSMFSRLLKRGDLHHERSPRLWNWKNRPPDQRVLSGAPEGRIYT